MDFTRVLSERIEHIMELAFMDYFPVTCVVMAVISIAVIVTVLILL